MGANINLSGFAVLLIFLLGVLVGWILAKLRAGAVLKIGLSSGSLGPATFKITRTAVRNMTLRCQCGAIWNFREGSGPFPPGTQPMPTGDSFVCPKCGKSIDLTLERQVEAEALAHLNLPNKTQI